MGLAERRAIATFQKDRFPGLKQKIEEAATIPVELDVDWASLAKEGEAENYEKALSNYFFVPLANALGQICIDQMGREALKEGLRGIKVTSGSGSIDVDMQGKLLVLKGDAFYYGSIDISDHAKKIVTTLEKGL